MYFTLNRYVIMLYYIILYYIILYYIILYYIILYSCYQKTSKLIVMKTLQTCAVTISIQTIASIASTQVRTIVVYTREIN